jgi:hypothetical protein
MQQTMLDALIRLSATGPTVIVSTTDRIPVMDADVVLDLTPEEGRAMWQLPPESQQVAILRQLDPAGRQRDPLPQLNSGSFMPAVPDAEIDQDAASASTELYRPDSYSGLYDDPDSPTEYYQPTGSDPATGDPIGSEPAAVDLTDSDPIGSEPAAVDPTGSDPTGRDRPNNPDTPTTGAPTEDNR